ncbi:MAG: hypothetical protein GY696_09505 [Gammaproteobacteria bacterium]|nr:hypothetical protein [Gammaproteobacteria bacterium]
MTTKKGKKWKEPLHIEHIFEVTTDPSIRTAYLGCDFGALFHKWEVDHVEQKVVFTWNHRLPLPVTKRTGCCPFFGGYGMGFSTNDHVLKNLKMVTINVPMHNSDPDYGVVMATKTTVIPPTTVTKIAGELVGLRKRNPEDLFFQPSSDFENTNQVFMDRQIFSRNAIMQHKLNHKKGITILIRNSNNHPFTLLRGTTLGELTPSVPVDLVAPATSSIDPQVARENRPPAVKSTKAVKFTKAPPPLSSRDRAKIGAELKFDAPEQTVDSADLGFHPPEMNLVR